jgi:hypothetical protein
VRKRIKNGGIEKNERGGGITMKESGRKGEENMKKLKYKIEWKNINNKREEWKEE